MDAAVEQKLLWTEAGRRAIKYEERNRGKIYKKTMLECTREMDVRKRQGRAKGKWEVTKNFTNEKMSVR